MTYLSHDAALIITAIMLGSVALMHLSHKNENAVWLYIVQSLAALLLLLGAMLAHATAIGILVAVCMLIVKIVAAPRFFRRLIRRHQLTFSASAYLSIPMTLGFLTLLTAASYAQLQGAFESLSPLYADALFVAFACMLAALFLIVNRRGALSQMLGVLSLENSIVGFAALSGLENAPMLQLGVLFDMFIWVVIATIFASMIYEKFGSLDVTAMAHLTEE